MQYPAQPSRNPTPIPSALSALLSAHVASRRADTLLTNEWGQRRAPWTLNLVMRRARGGVEGLPAGFRFQDLRHASAKTTLDSYGHLWPDSDDGTSAAVGAVSPGTFGWRGHNRGVAQVRMRQTCAPGRPPAGL